MRNILKDDYLEGCDCIIMFIWSLECMLFMRGGGGGECSKYCRHHLNKSTFFFWGSSAHYEYITSIKLILPMPLYVDFKPT